MYVPPKAIFGGWFESKRLSQQILYSINFREKIPTATAGRDKVLNFVCFTVEIRSNGKRGKVVRHDVQKGAIFTRPSPFFLHCDRLQ